jgi:hypothetical protein
MANCPLHFAQQCTVRADNACLLVYAQPRFAARLYLQRLNTPLHEAGYNGDPETVRLLLEAGAAVSVRNRVRAAQDVAGCLDEGARGCLDEVATGFLDTGTRFSCLCE